MISNFPNYAHPHTTHNNAILHAQIEAMYYRSLLALRNIDMPIYGNQVTVFIGPSGCGKSTLLRCLNPIFA
ncbi:ATP-binding cassette domain-containing protein [Calothrix rhizosoleniae]|uniref:ATP-binding cassette domain-containing protein n=1 Tax=Calothrix rhizosoleniae TaxID=888997 RepID=UPI000B498BF5